MENRYKIIGGCLNRNLKQWLQDSFAERVKFNEPMHRHTSFGIGGPAEAWVSPHTITEINQILEFARQHKINYTIIGGGSNLLIQDQGIPGIVMTLNKLDLIHYKESGDDHFLITAGAGCRLSALCRLAFELGIEQMNFATGIPGTIGGAVVMNAGTKKGSMADILESVTILRPGGQQTLALKGPKKQLFFSYRKITWKKDTQPFPGDAVILSATVLLQKQKYDYDYIRQDAEKIMQKRQDSQPVGKFSAGCFFKNPQNGSAGELIEKAGLKGFRIGDAQVSRQHANFIINRKAALAEDVIKLANHIRETVKAKFKVELETEVKIIGQ